MTRICFVIMFSLGVLSVSACGKKGDVLPPDSYQEPDYQRAPELEPSPMEEADKPEDEAEQDDR